MRAGPDITVVAEVSDQPAEGMNVISATLVADLQQTGLSLRVIPPHRLLRHLPGLILRPSALTVFTHGPGLRTVLVTRLLRWLSRTRLVWVATRPNIDNLPAFLMGWSTAHHVICNQPNVALKRAAPEAETIVQPIGMDPSRIGKRTKAEAPEPPLWPEVQARGVPILAHVGHLRQSRGLDRLIEIKAAVGAEAEVVVQASPTFTPEPGVLEALQAAGVIVSRRFVADIGQVYRSCTLYLFPVPEDGEGAIELPLTVLEALASKTPVIATPFGALPRVLNHTKGLSFAPSADFAQVVVERLQKGAIERPDGLPESLHAARLTETILRLSRQRP